jgi:hypothetical protein
MLESVLCGAYLFSAVPMSSATLKNDINYLYIFQIKEAKNFPLSNVRRKKIILYNCASVTIRRVIARTERTQLCGQEQGCKERKKTGEKIKTNTRAPFLWEDTVRR